MLRVGLIGTGAMARVHAERIAKLDSASIVAVASPNNAEPFADTHIPTAQPYTSIRNLCENQDVDVVDICTPTHTHRELIEVAAAHGYHILCEKPIARTLTDAHAIADIVADADITFMVGHTIRFFQEYVEAKQLVTNGEIGGPGVVRASRSVSFSGERGWQRDEEKSGGVLLDLAIHDFDFLRWTVGEVEQVFTRISKWGDHDENQASVTTLRFDNGAVGHVESSWMRLPTLPFSATFELAGDNGLVEYDTADVNPIEIFGPERAHTPIDPVGHNVPLAEDGYFRQLEHFFECVRNHTEPMVTTEDAIEALRLSLAAIESGEQGQPVRLDEVVA